MGEGRYSCHRTHKRASKYAEWTSAMESNTKVGMSEERDRSIREVVPDRTSAQSIPCSRAVRMSVPRESPTKSASENESPEMSERLSMS